MKITILFTFVITYLISCSTESNLDKNGSQKIYENPELITQEDQKDINTKKELIPNDKSELPADGKYRYEIAFAEWNGNSMGEKVTVMIKGDSIQIIYEGDGQLSLVKKGDVLDSGIIRKHKSGKWIITQSEDDVYLEEIGGCTGGPSEIDFKNKKFWMC